MAAQIGYYQELLAIQELLGWHLKRRRVMSEECKELGMCAEISEDGSALNDALEMAKVYADFAPIALMRTKN